MLILVALLASADGTFRLTESIRIATGADTRAASLSPFCAMSDSDSIEVST